MIRAALVFGLLAGPASAAEVHFCWAGADGYTMTGTMEFPDARLDSDRITEADVSAFRIDGFHDGRRVGGWSLDQRTPDTTWHLRYAPRTMTFPTGGSFPGDAGQGWNANGEVTDCGNPGFGFNSGNYAQDVCIDGVWIFDSSIPPETPFTATTRPVLPDCSGPALLGKRARRAVN